MEIAMRVLLSLIGITASIGVYGADVGLSGAVSSATGEKMAGVTVSAKAEGGTITTSVYTDKAGNYAFSPLPAGKYRVWAQAVGYQRAKSELELAAGAKQNFKLAAHTDPEQTWRQLPGNVALDL